MFLYFRSFEEAPQTNLTFLELNLELSAANPFTSLLEVISFPRSIIHCSNRLLSSALYTA